MYPAGHNVVLYHMESRSQRFIPGSVESEGITSLSVSANKRYLAVAEQAAKGMITVFDLQTLKRRKVLVSTDSGSKVGRLHIKTQDDCLRWDAPDSETNRMIGKVNSSLHQCEQPTLYL